ncbi:hypothetical protein ES708_12807 [subsurface metagenome]
MSLHFSVRDVVYTPGEDSVKVVVETDIPCYLICRQTSEAPRIHKKPVLRRGLWLNDDVRFCFTVFTDHEQEEPGDTLIHTFIKTGWPYCSTRWLYFWATIDGEACASTSAIFPYHNTYKVPPFPEPSRYAWNRLFTQYGAFVARAAGTGLATTFHIIDTPTTAYQIYLFSRNNDSVSVKVSLHEVDAWNKPIGDPLAEDWINLFHGVEDGGDGADEIVYRQTATLLYNCTPNTNYALVSMTLTNTAQWWVNFRRQGWIGDEDEGSENHIIEHYSQDAGESWIVFPPSHQNYEAWGFHF